MTRDALRRSAFWHDPNARIRLALTVPEATLLYGLTYCAQLIRSAGGEAAGEADRVLDWATCKLYTGLAENCGRGL